MLHCVEAIRMRSSGLLGTPTEETWPTVTLLPDYQATFPKWPPTDIRQVHPHPTPPPCDARQATGNLADRIAQVQPFNSVDEAGADLLAQMLVYAPVNRIKAPEALQHRSGPVPCRHMCAAAVAPCRS
jgi:hypothetical protein